MKYVHIKYIKKSLKKEYLLEIGSHITCNKLDLIVKIDWNLCQIIKRKLIKRDELIFIQNYLKKKLYKI